MQAIGAGSIDVSNAPATASVVLAYYDIQNQQIVLGADDTGLIIPTADTFSVFSTIDMSLATFQSLTAANFDFV